MDAEMLKGHLDAIVLAALEAGPAHGYAIIETIKTRSSKTFDLPEGTVYPALHRLEQAGLLSSTWTTPPGGRRRRVYSLTKAGAATLAERRKDWRRFVGAVGSSVGRRPWPACSISTSRVCAASSASPRRSPTDWRARSGTTRARLPRPLRAGQRRRLSAGPLNASG